MLGDKAAAKKAMKAAGVPVIPGSNGAVPTMEEAKRLASEEIGFPLMVKASAGGGGRGIRLVERMEDTEQRAPVEPRAPHPVHPDRAAHPPWAAAKSM